MDYLEIMYRGITVYAIIPLDSSFDSDEHKENTIRCWSTFILREISAQASSIGEHEHYESIECLIKNIERVENKNDKKLETLDEQNVECINEIIRLCDSKMIFSTIPAEFEGKTIAPNYDEIRKSVVDVIKTWKPGKTFFVKYHTKEKKYTIEDTAQIIGTMTISNVK